MIKNSLLNKKFGRLFVRGYYGVVKNRNSWECVCECGDKIIVRGSALTSGNTKSCGCLLKEVARKRRTTHGLTGTKVYRAWQRIKKSCFDKSKEGYENYGGRGITVCKSWLTFENFYQDMGEPPFSSSSIDRINNDGNYEPGNCRWADSFTQANNTRKNHPITLGAKTHNVNEWSRILGIDHRTIFNRIKRGWTDQQALAPVKK